MCPAGVHILSPYILNNMRQHPDTPGNHLGGSDTSGKNRHDWPKQWSFVYVFFLSFHPNFARVTHQIFKMLNGIRGEKEARVKKGQRVGGGA